eukprot:COSAG03_NODE_1113_length_4789_cov_2.441791_3_plen_74_part_00
MVAEVVRDVMAPVHYPYLELVGEVRYDALCTTCGDAARRRPAARARVHLINLKTCCLVHVRHDEVAPRGQRGS